MNKPLTGTHIIEKKWNLIWLKNKINNSELTIDYHKFSALLFQSFTVDQIKKILDAINSEKKLLIDFDNDTVCLIVEKDQPYLSSFTKHFGANNISQESIEEPLFL